MCMIWLAGIPYRYESTSTANLVGRSNETESCLGAGIFIIIYCDTYPEPAKAGIFCMLHRYWMD